MRALAAALNPLIGLTRCAGSLLCWASQVECDSDYVLDDDPAWLYRSGWLEEALTAQGNKALWESFTEGEASQLFTEK